MLRVARQILHFSSLLGTLTARELKAEEPGGKPEEKAGEKKVIDSFVEKA